MTLERSTLKSIAGIACKPRAFREEHLNHSDSKWRVGRWWDFVIGVLVPVQAVVLFIWMLVQAAGWEEDWLDPFGTTNVGTVLFQVGLVLFLLILANRWIARRSLREAITWLSTTLIPITWIPTTSR